MAFMAEKPIVLVNRREIEGMVESGKKSYESIMLQISSESKL